MNIKILLQKALFFYQNKDFVEAERILNKIIKKDKMNLDAHANLGTIYAIKREYKLSEIHFKLALKVKNSIQLKTNLINVLSEQKKYHEAKDLIDEALNIDPENINLLFTKAKIIRNLGEFNEALEILNSLYKKNTNDRNIAVSLAFTLNQVQNYQQAIEIYEKIITEDDNFFPAVYNCGLIYLNQRIDIDKSIIYLEKSLLLQPNHIELLLTLAAAYEEKYKFDNALELIEKARQLDPHDPRVYYQLGSLDTHSNNLESSLNNLNQCLKIQPNYHMANYIKSNILLQMGKFDEGFELYKYRLYNQNIKTRVNDLAINELSIEDCLVIFYEQGIGDVILYSRFFDEVIKKVKDVTAVIPEKLLDFFKLNFNGIKFLTEAQFKSDKYIEHKKINLATIPRLLNNIDKIISSPRILKSSVIDNKLLYRSMIGKEKICGIAWKSKNLKVGDHKSIELELLVEKIFNETNYKLINLQYGDVEEEINKQKISIEVSNVDLYNDISSTAALIDKCDVIVTTSNVTAHIAGVLGKETLLLAPRYLGKFWYWEKNLNIYHSIKIFNQDEDGSWKLAMKDLKDYLEKFDF